MTKLSIAIIWGPNDQDAIFTTDHSFFEMTARDRPDCVVHRYTWQNWRMMLRDHDLYLFLDYCPDLYHVKEYNFKNTAYYWWDSFHLPLAQVIQLASQFDRSYFAEKLSAIQAAACGFPVQWLPPAYYPGLYFPIKNRTKIHDYTFIGQQDDVIVKMGETRKSILAKLVNAPGIHGYIGQGIYGPVVNGIFNDSKILIDRTIFENIGTRFFSILGSGGFLLTNKSSTSIGLEDIAQEGLHYITYDNSYVDLETKIRFYLENEVERKQIAQQGHLHIKQNHTYAHRFEKILNDFNLV